MSNQAAWITEKQGKPLKVQEAQIPKPGPEEVVIKNHAIAINPVDWKVQDAGYFVEKFPNILGTDVAGEVYEVGSSVKAFKKGDRVMAHCLGLATTKPENGAFQLYTAVSELLTCKLPSSLSYTHATVLPLAISTAAAGLYQENILNLPLPTASPKDSGKVIVVWGGSSSVGTTVLQLAKASGVETVVTASKHNHEYCKKLGASHVIDYNSSSVVDDVVSAIKATGKDFAGTYDAISIEASFKPNIEILEKAGGKILGTVLPPPQNVPGSITAVNILAFAVAFQAKFIGEAVWGDYVPKALESGSLKCLPEPLVIGKGLEKVQEGMQKNKDGVSAKKVVIEL